MYAFVGSPGEGDPGPTLLDPFAALFVFIGEFVRRLGVGASCLGHLLRLELQC